MSKLEGGIFSRPRGKTGGLVFGAARTRDGKAVTARLLVKPSNPRTPAQQAQRRKFSVALEAVRATGQEFYRETFNRTIGQLPGFQALESILLRQMNSDGTFSRGPNINTGSAELPSYLWQLNADELNAGLMKCTADFNDDAPEGTKLHMFYIYAPTGDWNDVDDVVVGHAIEEAGSSDSILYIEEDVPASQDGQILAGTLIEYPSNSPTPRTYTGFGALFNGEIQDMKSS